VTMLPAEWPLWQITGTGPLFIPEQGNFDLELAAKNLNAFESLPTQ